MKFIIILSLISLVLATPVERPLQKLKTDLKLDDEATMSTAELIQHRGYPCEVHHAVTSDGYILALHRIPYGKKSGPADNKKVILVMHGILQSAADWVITGDQNGLGYILADQGFDVWLGNARGTTDSRNHTTLDPDHTDFWKFSWHEIGNLDLPANIDYILEHTNQESLHYVGYSQGTTSYFVMTSTRPEYNKKIQVATLMAPIAYMTHAFSPILRFAAAFDGLEEALFDLFGVGEFLPSSSVLAVVGDLLCGDDDITQALCTNSLFAICGFSPSEMNSTILPTLMGHSPAGASSRQLFHYAQEINSGHFRQYDHGMIENMAEYGSLSPPDYDPSKITAPTFLFYSKGDWLADTGDVENFCDKLSNCQLTLVSEETWNHLDYTYGINAPRLVYDKLVAIHSRY